MAKEPIERKAAMWKGFKVSCTCPDFTARHDVPISNTKTFKKDWSYSNAGAVGEKGELCKHIWNALLQLKLVDKSDIPTDVPIPIFLKSEEEQYPEFWQEEPYAGHDFSKGLGFSGFNPYKGG